MRITEIAEGTGRGYRRDEQGLLTVVDLPIVDGQPTDYMGTPYEIEGKDIVDLMGWPDSMAVEVSESLLIGIQ